MTASTIKSEAHQHQRKYPAGTFLALDLYENGNFFEATVKGVPHKDPNVIRVDYVDGSKTESAVDLDRIEILELCDETILTKDDCVEKNLSDEEKGYLGRRLTVKWHDNEALSGTITKILPSKKNWVFITYDCGDECWYNLLPEYQVDSQFRERETEDSANRSRSETTSKSSKIKKEESSSSKKTSADDAIIKRHEMAMKELEKKYPVGCEIAAAIYHDEHYHPAKVKKYFAKYKMKQMIDGEQWLNIEFSDKTKQYIDISCVKVVKIKPEDTLRLDEIKTGDDKGFLGKRLVVQWRDGKKYRGLATRSVKDNKHFVYVEYDDGDKCWLDLQREREWSIGDKDDEEDRGDEDGSDVSVNENPKRKGNLGVQGQSTKRARSTEEF